MEINMLDSNARRYVQPSIQRIANLCIKLKLSANDVTVIAFLIGMTASFFLYFNMVAMAVGMLWLSGLLDAVDGSIARATKTMSPWGTLMDLIFDRFVEMGLIVALALKYPESRIYFVFLLCSILFSMCVFLSVGALSANTGEKSFKYQTGVMERAEGFICFTAMAIFDKHLIYIVLLTTVLISYTALQRMREAKQIFTADQ